MNRYEYKRVFYPERNDGRGGSDMKLLLSLNGEWVKYSDVKALQARVRELEALAGEAVEVAQFYGDQCEEWYQRKYDYDKVISELKERLSILKGTP